MSEVEPASESLSVATWNIVTNNQERRVGGIANFLASRDPGLTILTELSATMALRKALTREIGPAYSFEAVATGSRYEDSIGLLVTSRQCRVAKFAEPVGPVRGAVPYFLKAELETPLGGTKLAAMRGAFLSRGWSEARSMQYRAAIGAVGDDGGIALVGGDMNSKPRMHNPIFETAGFDRLTTSGRTWPNRRGLRTAYKDGQVLSLPFLLPKMGISIDAIYGRGVVSLSSESQATGLSDHYYIETKIAPSQSA